MDAATRLQQLAREHFAAVYEALPVQATNLGIHTYDHTFGDYSSEKMAHNLRRLKDHLALVNAIEVDKLELSDAIDLALLESDINVGIVWYEQIAEWQKNPNFYAELAVNGVFLLTTREFAPLEQRAVSIIHRLNETPKVLKQAASNVVNPPKIFTEVAIETSEGAVIFLEQAISELAKAVPARQQELLQAKAKACSAYKDFTEFLKHDLLPRSKGPFAVGRETFEAKLRHEHMLDLSASELEAEGKRLFAEIERSMRELAAEINPQKEWHELIAEARTEHPSANELLNTYRTEVARLRDFVVQKDILTMPANEKLEITDTPIFMRSTLPYAAYLPPAPFESEQKGQLWVTPIDPQATEAQQRAQLQEHSHFALPIVALHETYPGHHVQIVCSDNASSFIRKHIANNLMCEGWALYCEHLMSELDYEPHYIASLGDPAAKAKTKKLFRLFVLKDALWRAARIIIDVGIHTGETSFDEAVKLLVEGAHLSEDAAKAEVKRYTMSPTQPMSYLVGREKILAMRKKFKRLPMKLFHDQLLACGTIPLSLAEKEIEAKAGGQH